MLYTKVISNFFYINLFRIFKIKSTNMKPKDGTFIANLKLIYYPLSEYMQFILVAMKLSLEQVSLKK